MKPNLIVMCGLQCSGKSTKAKELAKAYNSTAILSSDEYRLKNPNLDNDKIFYLLYQDMNNCLKSGIDVIVDATNTTIKSRKKLIENIKYDCNKICYIMNTPYKKCVERLKERNKTDYPNKFGEEVIKKYLYSFEVPFIEEGWNEIKINEWIQFPNSMLYMSTESSKAYEFDQKNKHHTQNLGEHMKNTSVHFKNNLLDSNKIEDISLLEMAAAYHDIGKLYTQTYKENDENAHYYNHANVGTYKMLCNVSLVTLQDTLTFLFYINYHMLPYDWKSEKTHNKWKQIFGEDKYNKLLMFNNADQRRD